MGRTLRYIPGGSGEEEGGSSAPLAEEAAHAPQAVESSAQVPVSPRRERASDHGPSPLGLLSTAPIQAGTLQAGTLPSNQRPAAFPTDTLPDLKVAERPLGPNDKVDRYIVERLIAAGGMARVYRAYHEWARRPVALKVLRTRYAGRPDLIDRFHKEAMALGQIKHPNVVTMENGGLTPTGEVFIAMEFLEGKTLRDVLQERPTLPIDEALSIVLQVARGVTAAHEINVIHRDIKPENIFCTSFGAVKVLDLGLAKIIGFDSKETDPDGLIGTAAYMAPEQLDGLPADARSDVYSLGLVTYECLAGFHPMVPDGVWPSREEIALRQLTFDPPPLRHLPRPVWQVVARATHKNPALRYASMQEFAAALQRLRHQLAATVSSEPGSTPAAHGRQAPAITGQWSGRVLVRRHPMLIGALVGLSTAAAIFAWRGRPGPIAGPTPPTPAPPSAPATVAARPEAPTAPPKLPPAGPAALAQLAQPRRAAVAPAAPASTAPQPDRTAALPERTPAAPSPAGSASTPSSKLAPKPRPPSSEVAGAPQPLPATNERSKRSPAKPAERMPSSGL